MITITRPAADGLAMSTWRFYMMHESGGGIVRLRLDYFSFATRATRRHGWQAVKTYHATDKRQNTISRADILIPADVRAKAIAGVTITISDD